MGSSEYLGWLEYLNREGWSKEKQQERADRIEFLLALLLSITANVNRDAKTHPEPFTVYDFAPWLKRGEAKEDRTQEERDADIAARGRILKAQLEARK